MSVTYSKPSKSYDCKRVMSIGRLVEAPLGFGGACFFWGESKCYKNLAKSSSVV